MLQTTPGVVRVLARGFGLGLGLAWLMALSLPTHAASTTLQVDGRVVDERGQAVEDARVTLREAPSLYDSLVAVLAEDPESEAAATILDETRTGADGIYRLQVGEPGIYRVVVESNDRASQQITLEPLVTSHTLATVTLPPSLEVEVHVTAAGRPVGDALVIVTSRLVPPTEWSTRAGVVRTDAEGRAQFVWPRAERRLVSVSAPDLLSFSEERPASRSSRVEVQMEAGESETLFLHDAQGRPLAGLVVALGRNRQPEGRSGEDGRIVVRLPARDADGEGDEMELRVLGDDGRYLRRGVAAEAEPELALEIPAPRVVDGRIYGRDNREPVADAVVWAYARASDAVRTDSDGRFRIHALEGVPIYSAGARGYQKQRGSLDEAEAGLGLQPIRAIVGRVTDRGGAGVAGAEVVAEPDVLNVRSSTELSELLQSTGRAFTDSEGRFRLEGLLADAGYEVKARGGGYAATSKRVNFAPDEPGERTVQLVLDPGRVGVGLVVDEADQPVVGAEVGLYVPLGERPRVWAGPPKEPEIVARAVSDSAGEFRLADLGEGSFFLEVSAEGFAPLKVPGIDVGPYVDSEPVIDLGVAVLVRGAEIHGRVLDGDSEPVAGAQILSEIPSIYSGAGLPALPEAVSDAEGRFLVGGLEPGVARRVVARAEGFIEAELQGVMPRGLDEADEEDAEVVLVLHGPSWIRGRVVGPEGEAVAGAIVSSALIQTSGSGSAMRSLTADRTDDSGAFELPDLPPGNIQLRIRAEGYRHSEGHLIPVPPGETVDGVVVQLETGAVLAGRVVDADGNPVPGALISSRRPELGRAGLGPRTRSAGDGTFRLEGMPPGTSELVVRHEDFGMAMETVDLQLGGEEFLKIRLAGASVSGQVVTPDGEPATGATVGVRKPSPQDGRLIPMNVMEVSSRTDGTFEIESIPDGAWVVVAEHGDLGSARSEEFEAAGAPLDDLYLQLQSYATLTGEIRGLRFEQLAETEVLAVSPVGLRVGEVRHDGTYRVERLTPGDWGIVANAGSRQVNESLTVEAGMPGPTLDLAFGGGEVLEGVVLLDGTPLDGAEVTCIVSGENLRVGRTDHLGRFRIDGLDEGGGELLVTHLRSSLRYSTTVQIPRDEPLRLDIRTSSVFGHVVDAVGSTVGAVTVVLEEVPVEVEGEETGSLRRIDNPRPEVTDARGKFRFGGLTEGTWRLRAEKDGYAPSEQTLTLQGGAELGPVVFRLERTDGDS